MTIEVKTFQGWRRTEGPAGGSKGVHLHCSHARKVQCVSGVELRKGSCGVIPVDKLCQVLTI